ncbi:hypothetical protein OHC33_009149 [Knufia fluminis]|uniref:CAP-Gly domain-containing protein n=1 Tax=Knufia fluminis TaxID=191047 RepID=A0AAN8I4D0_9EURO|nr:hypothetical protein OHC33_009149 [Knufia fluminis]
MPLTTPHDIPLLITVPSNPSQQSTTTKPLLSAERRITPTWSISTLKSKLEPITGIPSTSQTLRTRSLDGTYLTLQPDTALVGDRTFNLTKGSEIEVIDSRPPGSTNTILDFQDVSKVDKYVMPESKYEQLDDSVLAWKRKQKLGRFDPNAKSLGELIEERRGHDSEQIRAKGISVGMRCRVNGSDERRGTVRYVGEIEGLGGEREAGCAWVGVEFDEPVGRNDGSVEVEVAGEGGKKGREMREVFECKGEKYGGFARPEKVEVGEEFEVLDDLVDEDMEEI